MRKECNATYVRKSFRPAEVRHGSCGARNDIREADPLLQQLDVIELAVHVRRQARQMQARPCQTDGSRYSVTSIF